MCTIYASTEYIHQQIWAPSPSEDLQCNHKQTLYWKEKEEEGGKEKDEKQKHIESVLSFIKNMTGKDVYVFNRKC